MSTPVWVTRLAERVCAEQNVPLPVITWHRSRHAWSSGHTWYDRSKIHVTAGTDLKDRRMVLLHELAHWILMHRSDHPEGHSAWFWEIAFTLYKQHGLLRYATDRESDFKKSKTAAVRASKRRQNP